MTIADINAPMRVAFDGTTLRPFQTGVGYYTEHLLQHLVQVGPQHLFHVVSNREIETSVLLTAPLRIESRGRFPIRNVWLQTLAPLLLKSVAPQVAHFTNSVCPLIKTCPTVLTIHDMTLSLFPQLHPSRRTIIRPLVNRSARQADAIITVSHNARDDMVRLLGVPAEKIHVIYEAPAPWFKPQAAETCARVRARYRLPEKFILFVGTIEPRKNLVRLLDAFAALKARNHKSHRLVFAGFPGWGYREVLDRIARLELREDVHILGYVPFHDLAGIYNLCEVFVFPSLYEGFGLPMVEAMACGKPVVASITPALSEIFEDAYEPVDPEDSDSIHAGLERVLGQPDYRQALSERGLELAAQFSWSSAAQQTLAVYHSVANPGS